MYGRWEGELWFYRRHMWSVPSPSTPSLVAPISSSVFIDSNSFSTDGRKIHVGDCALFIPPNDSPPFIGIIRRLIPDNDDNLTLSVNWLYRPSDVKLLKGASLEAAPNEVFYSFHQDEIPAASLLHPCKVAFLHKGVELPSRVSSFICRRVYDVETKKLWWLTDQDYTNERQEVVNKLLNKTQLEMYGGQNGPNGTTQVKGKKREHSSDSDMLKEEIAKITEKGGLVNLEGVEKIIQLMQPENGDKKVDLHSRILLVNVISVTDRFDLLGKFVQLKGLLILDEWLQEFHKGKIGDGLKESDKEKSVEEFLFALLRALDRLPVNIHALQTCNVGKSVNHLRSHKNPEILKKARILVDMWKKRVEDEMNMMERKRIEQMNGIETRSGTRRGGSGSWSNKSTVPEVSPNSVKQVKNFTSQNSSPKQEKQSPESSSPTKPPVPVPAGTGTSDVPAVTIKEEKSSSSSHSSKGPPKKGTPKRSTADNVGEESNGADSASNGTLKLEKSYEDSYSSINALVESCAKISEGDVAAPAGDDGGMDLLASVAAGEVSGSDVSPSHDPENKQSLPEDTCLEDNGNSKQPIEDVCQSEDNIIVTNGHASLAENKQTSAEVGTTPGTSEKDETRVSDESASRLEKKEDEKKENGEDSEMLTSSCSHVSVERKAEQSEDKANTDPDSSNLQTSENVDKNDTQEEDGKDPPASTSASVSETAVKLDFDLNEVLPSDDNERPAESQKARAFLDFDLNVGVDDVDIKGGLDLNMNACDESPDVGPLTVPNNPQPSPILFGGFDLNGPGVEENGGESISHSRNGIQFLPNAPSVVRTGNFHTWFPQSSTTYPAIPIQTQSYQPQKISNPMNPEILRGPVLSSSPALRFSSTTPFQFPGFPFETNFPLPSNTPYVTSATGPGPICFPTMPSQLVGPTYRPYVMSLPGGPSNVGPDNRKYGSHGLDLNSGPGGPDQTLPSGLRQLPQIGDEQLKMFQQMGMLKRKEPVDGWDADRLTYKHPSWH